ncbi:hypothetical protein HMPREF1153_1562 [Selenomonas sp. CM52]|nr:hypothetical protein HMPREF1153_1562 [Selenomonas sp. CM52]
MIEKYFVFTTAIYNVKGEKYVREEVYLCEDCTRHSYAV